jgi:hypothetical protein
VCAGLREYTIEADYGRIKRKRSSSEKDRASDIESWKKGGSCQCRGLALSPFWRTRAKLRKTHGATGGQLARVSLPV